MSQPQFRISEKTILREIDWAKKQTVVKPDVGYVQVIWANKFSNSKTRYHYHTTVERDGKFELGSVLKNSLSGEYTIGCWCKAIAIIE